MVPQQGLNKGPARRILACRGECGAGHAGRTEKLLKRRGLAHQMLCIRKGVHHVLRRCVSLQPLAFVRVT